MVDSCHEMYNQLIQSYLRLAQVSVGCQQTFIIHRIEVFTQLSQGHIELFLQMRNQALTVHIQRISNPP